MPKKGYIPSDYTKKKISDTLKRKGIKPPNPLDMKTNPNWIKNIRRGKNHYRWSGGNIDRFPNGKCSVCGWNKSYCDRNRIKQGKDGGLYEKGNVISVCPNCHRLIHSGLLVI